MKWLLLLCILVLSWRFRVVQAGSRAVHSLQRARRGIRGLNKFSNINNRLDDDGLLAFDDDQLETSRPTFTPTTSPSGTPETHTPTTRSSFTVSPTSDPTNVPTTTAPTWMPTQFSTQSPTDPTIWPSSQPTTPMQSPSEGSTGHPTTSARPTKTATPSREIDDWYNDPYFADDDVTLRKYFDDDAVILQRKHMGGKGRYMGSQKAGSRNNAGGAAGKGSAQIINNIIPYWFNQGPNPPTVRPPLASNPPPIGPNPPPLSFPNLTPVRAPNPYPNLTPIRSPVSYPNYTPIRPPVSYPNYTPVRPPVPYPTPRPVRPPIPYPHSPPNSPPINTSPVLPPHISPSALDVTVDKFCYGVNEQIVTAFYNQNPQTNDFIGVYYAGDVLNGNLGRPLLWLWTCGTQVSSP